jgi:hypothetical protein
MSPLIRFISWTMAIGNGGAAANACRAIEERAQAEAAVEGLSARLDGIAPPNHAAPSRAA